MTTTATIDLDQAIDWDALYAHDEVTEDEPCTTCHGETLLPCPGCHGELGPLHSCEACELDETACDCTVCGNDGLVSCTNC